MFCLIILKFLYEFKMKVKLFSFFYRFMGYYDMVVINLYELDV